MRYEDVGGSPENNFLFEQIIFFRKFGSDSDLAVTEKYSQKSEQVAGSVNQTVVTLSVLDTPDVFTCSK